ncbi:MAG: hypothetical protein E7447_00960 [Ruminococcaceae bacterium]|nr:hypothetical protein [Oscillospiraceae bacterium]
MSTPLMTPQEIGEISFKHATFGGYEVQAVDEILGRMADDYVTLYQENALLKSKMRILVTKLEEYRSNDAAMKEAIAEAQNSCDTMIRETELKCAQMLTEASAMAAENTRQAEAAMAIENARVEEAQRVAKQRIDRLTQELNACLQALNKIRDSQTPGAGSEAIFDYDQEPDDDITAAVADEISHNLENLVGTAEEPVVTDTTSKFAGLSSHFGPDYDPTNTKK